MIWLPKKTVLVPVDFSSLVFEATQLVRTMVADVKNLHVLNVLVPESLEEPNIAWEPLTDQAHHRQEF